MKIINLFKIYLFLLTFNIINREFVPFFDLRFFILFLSLILIFIKFRSDKENKQLIAKDVNIKLILTLYFFIIISNIFLLYNGLLIKNNNFQDLIILTLFNLMNIITIYLYSNELNSFEFIKYFKFSFLFLGISMLISSIFGKLPFSDYSGIICGTEHINLFGQNCRLSGYLIDPNYVTLISILMIVLVINNKENLFSKIFYILLSLLYISLSFSKTIILTLPFILIINVIISKINNKKIKNIFLFLLIVFIFLLPILLLHFKIFDNFTTMHLRYIMWENGMDLFFKNPLFGNGIGSFRSYLSLSIDWFIQSHSTIIQILSEHGILTLIIFGLLLYSIIKESKSSIKFIFLIFLVWSINYETLYLNFMILFLAILPNLYKNDNLEKISVKKKNAIIFLVNSLCNGGAERVVVNMANEYSTKYKVFIITLYDDKSYILNDNIKIISLYNSKLSSIKKIIKLPIIVNKFDNIIKDIDNNYNIKLITSHLIYSNLISKLSMYSKSIVNVIHVSYKVYDKRFHFLFKKGLQFLYNNTPIVTVSNGCKYELTEIYKIKPLHIKTIYNPVNITEIQKMMSEKCNITEPFVLFVGRLDTPKRPDLLIDIFYQGKFYKKYKLCMAGVGPYEDKIKEKIKNYNIEKDVILLGWQMNVFKYMKNAKLFVNCSRNEAFPMTMIEALVCKCPVVSFDIDYGPNEILIDDLAKFLAKDGDIKSMIDVMNKALKKYPSFNTINIDQFSVSYVNKNYLDTYKLWNK